MQRILITGGCGFIGSAIYGDLVAAGRDVYVFDNLTYASRAFIDIEDDHFLLGDILDRRLVFETVGRVKPDVIIHLAAIHFIPHCNKFPYESAKINLEGTANVLDAARSTGSITKMLFASTAAVYPIVDQEIAETNPLGPLDIYGLAKMIGERLCSEFHLATGIPTVVCRFFNAFGPNETNPHLIPEIQRQVNAGSRVVRLGNLEPKRDFIHTRDMAAAVCGLIDRFADGYDVFNVGRGEEYSVREIVAAFARAIGEDIAIEVDPDKVRKTDRLHLLADVSKLKAFLGWQPRVSLDAGIKTLVTGSQ